MTGSPAGSSVAELLARLAHRRQTLAVAESLTGGLLAATLVDVPGASRVFRGGLVVYATDLKDTLAARDFLVATGYVDPNRVGITGGSYGGYMTLMAIGRAPTAFAAREA